MKEHCVTGGGIHPEKRKYGSESLQHCDSHK